MDKRKNFRYMLYLLIGVGIYYITGADQDPEVLSEFRSSAPIIIALVVLALILIKFVRSRKESSKDE